METRLKKWKFHRYIKRDGWRYIRRQIEKRSDAGKLSQVTLSGVVLEPAKVAKETERYRPLTWKYNNTRSQFYHG